MKYIDVLSICWWTEAGSTGWYFVHTVKANTRAEAVRLVARKTPAWFYGEGRELQRQHICGAGEVGEFDNFMGKHEGQFIEEALCQDV